MPADKIASARVSVAFTSPAPIASARSNSTCDRGRPRSCSTVCTVRWLSPTLSRRSSSDSESRMLPAPALATSSSASSSARMFSCRQTSLRWPAISRVGMLRKSYRWHRDRMVGQHLLRLGRGEDELHVRRRLLQRLQQGVEGVLGEHVHFVDDVHLEPRAGRAELGVGDDVADVVDAGVAGGVDLDDVQVLAAGDRQARIALAARLGGRACRSVRQLRHLARMRAVEVLPVPRVPQNR